MALPATPRRPAEPFLEFFARIIGPNNNIFGWSGVAGQEAPKTAECASRHIAAKYSRGHGLKPISLRIVKPGGEGAGLAFNGCHRFLVEGVRACEQ